MIIDNVRLASKKRGNSTNWTNNVNLLFIAFCSVFYIRVFVTFSPAPSILNHAHFIVVPVILWIVLATAQIQDRKRIRLINSLLVGLFLLLTATLISAFWNEAGLINAVASFMMLGEPIMFLIAVIAIPMSVESFFRIKKWFMWSVVINFLLAAIQKPLINSGKLYAEGFNGTDGCGGVFFVSGAGNYVSASVSMTVAIYFLANEKLYPLWIRISVFLAGSWQVLFSDSKQLVFAYGVAWVLLVLFSFQNFANSIKLLTGLLVVGLMFYWCVHNLEAFKAYIAWARPELYTPDGEAWYAKFYSIRAIIAEFQSPLNYLFGLGPGHTVSRLGAWFLNDYSELLEPLGATTTNIGLVARTFVKDFWLTLNSSMFSPIFGWAGIFGDLGLVGLFSYLFLGYIVWQNFGLNDAIRITLYTIIVLGFIFTQLEEPGYMVSVAMLLGLIWQEKRIKDTRRESIAQVGNPDYIYHSSL